MANFTNFNANIVKASYLACLVIAKFYELHTFVETLVARSNVFLEVKQQKR